MTKKYGKPRLILAGDIGGTKTRLGVFQSHGAALRLIRTRDFHSSNYSGLKSIVASFLDIKAHIPVACFGVAGPVVSGTATATNLPWKIVASSLKSTLSIENVSLINDLVANAYGIEVMSAKDFMVLNRGQRSVGNKALLAAGTGLGAAIMFWDGKHYIPSPSESGHVEFGPRNRLDLCLLQHLFERFGHVSYERVLSGAGLFNIYQFLRDRGKDGAEPGWLRVRLAKEDPAALIAESARIKKSRLCSAALDLFVSIYGAAAGNLALQSMAMGGVYLGGGIAPKIIWKLKDGTFIKAFKEKGRLTSIVERIPVKVLMNDRAALLGAAAYAAKMSEET
jgi:glucokinase